MPRNLILKPGWYLIETDLPHDLVLDPATGDPLRFDDLTTAQAYTSGHFQPHDVAFLFIPHDNFAWGE